MTIFLHGPDSYRRTQRLHIALDQFTTKYPGLGVRRFDAEFDTDAFALTRDALASASLFSPRTLVVLTDALRLAPTELQQLIRLTVESQTQHLVLLTDVEKLTKPYASLVVPPVQIEVFPILSGAAWNDFVVRCLHKASLTLPSVERQQLSTLFLGDTWGLVREIDVLVAMPAALRHERLQESRRDQETFSVSWQQLRLLVTGTPPQRLSLLARIEASGDAAAKTFAMAGYSASAPVAARGDHDVKTGALDYEEALLGLVVA